MGKVLPAQPADHASDGVVRNYLEMARVCLHNAADAETCPWCRAHIVEVATLSDELLSLSELSHEMEVNDAVMTFVKRAGASAEAVGALAFLGRVVRQLHRLGWNR